MSVLRPVLCLLLTGGASTLMADSPSAVTTVAGSRGSSGSYIKVSVANPAIVSTWNKGDADYLFDLGTRLDGSVSYTYKDSTAGGTHALAQNALAEGLHSAGSYATAHYFRNDNDYNTYQSDSVSFLVDLAAPTGSLQLVGTSLTVTAADKAGLQKIEMLVDYGKGNGFTVYNSLVLATDPSAPGEGISSFSRGMPMPPEGGTYPVLAKIYDFAGNVTPTAALTITNVVVTAGPKPVTLFPGGTQQFSATVAGSSNTAVSWEPSSNITAQGLYTAPSVPGTYNVTARSQADSSRTSVIPVTVRVLVAASPTTVTLQPGGIQQFKASVQSGTASSAVKWTATGGSIDANGLYTAPNSIGTYTITAQSLVDPSPSASATSRVTVEALQIQRWATQQGSFTANQKWVAGDFNHDGLTDLARIFNDGGSASVDVFLASANKTFTMKRWATQMGGFWDAQQWVAGDFNGDGRCDLARVFSDSNAASVDVLLSTGNDSFTSSRWVTRQGGFWDAQRWVAGDFNGDGRCDLANVFNDNGLTSIDVHASTGSTFGIQRWATQLGNFSVDQKWVAGNFNGDAYTDLVRVLNDNGYASMDVFLSLGNGSFTSARWATQQGGFLSGQVWMTGDFYGLKRSDLVSVFSENYLASIDIHTLLGNADHFVLGRWATMQGEFNTSQKWLTGDFNGDGLADAACVFSDNYLTSIDVHTCKH